MLRVFLSLFPVKTGEKNCKVFVKGEDKNIPIMNGIFQTVFTT